MWTTPTGDDYDDDVAVLTITNDSTGTPVTSVPIVTSVGDGVYTAAWIVPDTLTLGTYTARLTGLVATVVTLVLDTVCVWSDEMYLSVQEFKDDVMPTNSSTLQNRRIAGVLAAVSACINSECGRTFTVPSGSEARIIDPDLCSTTNVRGEGVLLVEDIATPDGVAIETGRQFFGGSWTALTADSWYANRSKPNWPYTEIIRASPWQSCHTVRVTAQWGWPRVPPAVIEATRIQAARVFSRKGSPEGSAAPKEWGIVHVPRLDPDVRTLLTGLQVPGIA